MEAVIRGFQITQSLAQVDELARPPVLGIIMLVRYGHGRRRCSQEV